MKIIYSYSNKIKEFINAIEIDEKYGVNIPFTTEIKPLNYKEGFAVVFNKTEWVYEIDNRDKIVYSKETKEPSTIDYLGEIKEGYTFEEPKHFDKWDYGQNKWVEDTEDKELNRINLINQKANEIIEAKYPIYKQLNIRAKLMKNDEGEYYTDSDIEIMDMFIDTARGIAKQAKSNGTRTEDIDWVGLDK